MNQIKEFIMAVQTDAAFDEKIHALLQDGKITELLEAAEQKGFSITETDLREYREGKGVDNELPEEALENIAGGNSGLPDGSYGNPFISEECWFLGVHNKHASYILCERLGCKKIANSKKDGVGWHRCKCWGTGRCRRSHHDNNTVECGIL